MVSTDNTRPRFGSALLWLATVVLVSHTGAGCATSKGLETSTTAASSGDVTGTWEGSFERDVNRANGGELPDKEIERHTWRLQQVGETVRGVLFVELTLISRDGRPFVCSGRSQLTAWLTSEVVGHRKGDLMVIAEQKAPRSEGACQPPDREASQYAARLAGDTLLIGSGRQQQQLVRRRNATPRTTPTTAELAIGSPVTMLAMVGAPPFTSGVGHDEKLQGHWVWEQQAQLPNGDAKREREEWHLVQEGNEVVGFYDRTVEQRSTDGRLYRCNASMEFRTVTRYEVRGSISGNRFTFKEHGFEILEGGPCDDGRRQLDSYSGEIRDSEMILTFGVGRQILRKARTTVPTQRF
jgi:hypothetical protein